MVDVVFSDFAYFPCLRSSEPEIMAYTTLSTESREDILPIFELSQTKYEAGFAESVQAISEATKEAPFFVLDLSKDRAPAAFTPKNNPDLARIKKLQAAQDAYNAAVTALLNPSDGFEAWRSLASKFPTAAPALQFTDPETQGKHILRQAAMLVKSGCNCMAIRIAAETNEAIFPIVGQIISILESAAQLLVIIDCGQGRQKISERAEFAKKAIARIVEEVEPSQAQALSAVCLSDFFMSPSATGLVPYENNSWELWTQASETFPFLFGDYCAHTRHKKANTFMPGEWKAQVVYPLPKSWLVYRHPNSQDAQGWIDGAKAIAADDELFDGFPKCWGGELLKSAANGNIEGVASARFWHAAKINMHIHRQIGHAFEVMGDDP